jgi:hypothetical protein
MEDELHSKYPGAFKSKEDFQNKLKNDFLNYVLQKWLYNPKRFSRYTPYKSLAVQEEIEIVPAGLLQKGIFLDQKNKKLNVDFTVLNEQFKSGEYEKESYWLSKGLSPVSSTYFNTGDEKVDFNTFLNASFVSAS